MRTTIILLVVALASPAMATPHPVLYDREKAAVCAKVRAIVNRIGVERAIQLARKRGYSDAQIAAAQSCL